MQKPAKINLHLGLCVCAYVWWSIVFNLLVVRVLVNLENRKTRIKLMFAYFDLIVYVPSTIFQLNRDGSSWIEPVLS